MSRRYLHLATAIALGLLVAGPLAPAAAASNGPEIVTEAIDDHHTHVEPDGSTVTFTTVGTRTTKTFPNGRYMLDERYADEQVFRAPDGTLVFESVADVSVHVIAQGESTVHFRSVSNATVTSADGTVCTFATEIVVANDQVVKEEISGPICA